MAGAAAAGSQLPNGCVAHAKSEGEQPPVSSYLLFFIYVGVLSVASMLFSYFCLSKVFWCCRRPPADGTIYISERGGTYHMDKRCGHIKNCQKIGMNACKRSLKKYG